MARGLADAPSPDLSQSNFFEERVTFLAPSAG